MCSLTYGSLNIVTLLFLYYIKRPSTLADMSLAVLRHGETPYDIMSLFIVLTLFSDSSALSLISL